MLNFLNTNPGLISAIEVLVVIIIAVIGFFINKNISKINQKQEVGDNSKAMQGGRDTVDKSINVSKD